jgi:hypothetical protein
MTSKKVNLEIKKQNGNIDDEFIKEFNELMKEHNIATFYFYGEGLEGWYERLEFSNLDMMKLLSRILFESEGFEATRDLIISDILRYIDPLRIEKEKNDKEEWIDVPFIPSVYLQEV